MRFSDSLSWLLSANPLPKGAAYACSGFSSRGGVSHCDARRLRGQSTIEYVLLIAIIALVVIVAGPGVASAIRNQFGAVTGALGNGISKGDWEAGGSGTGPGTTSDADIYDPVNGTAFAVYSEDDHSLMFYKRRGVPAVGDMFNSRKVTEVYSGIEDYDYQMSDPAQGEDACISNIPWWGHRHDVLAVRVVDRIRPKSMNSWFFYFTNCMNIDLGPIDTSECTNFKATFDRCSALTSLNLSSFDTSSAKSIELMFYGDVKLTELDLSNFDFSHVTNMGWMFMRCSSLKTLELPNTMPLWHVWNFESIFRGCKSLTLDCSSWNVISSASRNAFNFNAPGVSLPKAWR